MWGKESLELSYQHVADMHRVQSWLNIAYQWARDHGMIFSFSKTLCVRVGRVGMSEDKYKGDNGEEIEFEEEIRDLGIYFSHQGDYRPTVERVRVKTLSIAHWGLRTFLNRSLKFMKFFRVTYLGSQLEYCSPAYYPSTYSEIDALEGLLRMWSRRTQALASYHYWDRLKLLGMSSVQQRAERFKVLTFKKIISGEMPHIEGFEVKTTRRGVEAVLPHSPGRTPGWVKEI